MTRAETSFFATDEVVREQYDDHTSFFKAHTQTPKKQSKATPAKTFRAGDLAAQSAQPSNKQLQLDALTDVLGTLTENDFAGPVSLGSSDLALYFDGQYKEKSFGPGLRDMLNSPASTRKAIANALTQLPEAERADAAKAIMEKLETRLCGEIQRDMNTAVNQCADIARAEVSPFCDADPKMRAKLIHGLATSDLSRAQIQANLQKAGIDPGTASGLSQDIAALQKKCQGNDSVQYALEDAVKHGNFDAPQWENNTLERDGELRQIEEDLQKAFIDVRDGIDTLKTQADNDQIQGDRMFSNPLFEKAFDQACEQRGIKPGSNARKMLDERMADQKKSDKHEAYLCTAIMATASLAVPGGLAVAMGTGAVSSAPGVLVAQETYVANKGGYASGTSDAKAVARARHDRDVDVGMAIVGLVIGAAGNASKGAAGTSALDDAMSSVKLGDANLIPDDAFRNGIKEGARNAKHIGTPVAQEAAKEFGSAFGQSALGNEFKK